jgi:hypothetical protein
MPHSAPLTVEAEQVDLLSVAGQLDGDGLRQPAKRLDELLDGGARLLFLFDLPARTNPLLDRRGGWLRPFGLGPTALDALDQGELAEVLLAYGAAEWASHGVG